MDGRMDMACWLGLDELYRRRWRFACIKENIRPSKISARPLITPIVRDMHSVKRDIYTI